MKKNRDTKLALQAVCPACHKLSTFELRTVAEIKAFRFRPHDCPSLYCRKRGLTGWLVRQS